MTRLEETQLLLSGAVKRLAQLDAELLRPGLKAAHRLRKRRMARECRTIIAGCRRDLARSLQTPAIPPLPEAI